MLRMAPSVVGSKPSRFTVIPPTAVPHTVPELMEDRIFSFRCFWVKSMLHAGYSSCVLLFSPSLSISVPEIPLSVMVTGLSSSFLCVLLVILHSLRASMTSESQLSIHYLLFGVLVVGAVVSVKMSRPPLAAAADHLSSKDNSEAFPVQLSPGRHIYQDQSALSKCNAEPS